MDELDELREQRVRTAAFLAKPFGLDSLLLKVREALNPPPRDLAE
jgi:hypothetical protein